MKNPIIDLKYDLKENSLYFITRDNIYRINFENYAKARDEFIKWISTLDRKIIKFPLDEHKFNDFTIENLGTITTQFQDVYDFKNDVFVVLNFYGKVQLFTEIVKNALELYWRAIYEKEKIK